MPKKPSPPAIRLRGVRQHNLKNFDLDLPIGKLTVITGLSGSGKSSLAFDTLFAEGQRRYIETFSPYARQFFDRMDKPKVDRIEGIPPAIAIEQRNSVKTTRSTVGTMTELTDYMKVLWPHLAQLHCRQCDRVVTRDQPQQIWTATAALGQGDAIITFNLAVAANMEMSEMLSLVSKQGYQRLWWNGAAIRLAEAGEHLATSPVPAFITVVQDRVKVETAQRARFIEACEQAYHFGKGKLEVHWWPAGSTAAEAARRFSKGFHCAVCDLEYREASSALFSFNNPLGACPTCRGFGRVISIDYNLAIPDRSKPLGKGAVKPFQTGQGLESQNDLARFARARKVPLDQPFETLPAEIQKWVVEGEIDHTQPLTENSRVWYGVRGYFRWLESKAYKMHVRVLLARYRSYQTCPDCQGQRFQPESLLYRSPWMDGPSELRERGLTLSSFYQLPIEDAIRYMESVQGSRTWSRADPIAFALEEVVSRLSYLMEVGLGYLTLDRTTRSLSGGETERVNLTTCLGTRLVNTLFVLDEPSVGLHPRDTGRLVKVLHTLRDAGNTVVVVEHESSVMRAADQLVEIGPGHGESGGQVVFQGTMEEMLRSGNSLTGKYLSGRMQITPPAPRPVDATVPRLSLRHVHAHNLRDFSVDIPLGRFVCLTGVSGSGKSTLARDALLPMLQARLASPGEAPDEEEADPETAEGQVPGSYSEMTGAEHLGGVLMLDQSPLGRTPRSNPAVYIGAFDHLREFFAQTDGAKQRGFTHSSFSFNSPQGQCERCRGAGFEKIEMQFLSDVFIRCPECQGRRYRPHILEVEIMADGQAWNIADFLDAPVEKAVALLIQFAGSRAARRAAARLQWLVEVGLGYLRLGQPVNTLSGGESQRLKLVRHLAEAMEEPSAKPLLFLLDEPTTGLHFDDVRVLQEVFQKLVDRGHSLLVIEHQLDLIRCADWVIDLGPEAGQHGGKLVGQGTPDMIEQVTQSITGQELRKARAEIQIPAAAA